MPADLGPRAGSCLLLSQQLQGPQHQGACPEQVNAICPALTRCPSSCLLLPAGHADLREAQPASLPSLKWFFSARAGFLLSPQGLWAQSLPGIYRRGGALLKNTWSPFIEISKGIESMFLREGGGLHRVGYTSGNRAH